MTTKKKMVSNAPLRKAFRGKNDEFYTQMQDVEAELDNYKEHLRGKVVYCNCDDPEWSNFWKYFYERFADLGLRRLIATHYKEGGGAYKLEYDGRGLRRVDLQGDGDFRSPEAVSTLQGADVVITNPPFSLFRDFVGLMMEHGKEFLVLGTINATTYKLMVEPLIAGEVRLGYTANRSMEFRLGAGRETWSRTDADGNRYGKVGGITWYTNLPVDKPCPPLPLTRQYFGNEADYPTYLNRDAINVDKVADIPSDYFGVMGVPITYWSRHCPEQFEVVGARVGDDGQSLRLEGRTPYARLLIQRRGE